MDEITKMEELNTTLYKKMFAAQERYKEWLLKQSPEEILNHAYEYTCRSDILLSLEYNDLSESQAQALLDTDDPLSDIFKDWEKTESSLMADLWTVVEARADKTVLAQKGGA